MDLEQINNAVDFLLVLGQYWCQRVEAAWKILRASFTPWNVKAFFGGLAGIAYLFAVLIFLVVLIYDGFGRNSQRNFAILVAIFILFVASFLK